MNYKRLFIPNSYIHIVIVAYERQCIFLDNIELLKNAFVNSKKYFNYEIIAICVLPDHIHMVLNPENIDEYPKIITSIKYYFSHNYNVGVETSTYNNIYDSGTKKPTYGYLHKGEKGIFQRRYFEHTIINQEDLNNQINYIHYNPVKHALVKSVKDWKYSSFNKYVQQNLYDINWGSEIDIKNILDIEYE